MKIKSAYLLAVCFAILGLSSVVTAQHPNANPAKRHATSRTHRKHRRQRWVTFTLTPEHAKGVYYIHLPAWAAKKIEMSKDKKLVVVP